MNPSCTANRLRLPRNTDQMIVFNVYSIPQWVTVIMKTYRFLETIAQPRIPCDSKHGARWLLQIVEGVHENEVEHNVVEVDLKYGDADAAEV